MVCRLTVWLPFADRTPRMLSPSTFIGIASALTGAGRLGNGRSVPGDATATVQQARVLSPPSVGVTLPPSAPRPQPSLSLTPTAATPPRNLPRGSLLDLIV